MSILGQSGGLTASAATPAPVLTFDDRAAGQPLIERVWRSRSGTGGHFQSMAEAGLELVISRVGGAVQAILRGPVTRGCQVECPPDGEWLAIRFRPSVYAPGRPTRWLMDHRNALLPITEGGRLWLDGEAWEAPDFDNVEVFVARLAQAGLIALDPVVDAVVRGDDPARGARSVQRRFRRATGLTAAQFRQIRQARRAAALLQAGGSILDVAFEAGYFDQAHMTRQLARFVGQTPRQLLRREAQLSFSYKTEGAPEG